MAIAPVGPHRIRRPFDADGVRMIPGEIVDVTEWRNAYQLVDRGYLVRLDPSEVTPAPVKKVAAKKAPAKKVAAKKAPQSKSDD